MKLMTDIRKEEREKSENEDDDKRTMCEKGRREMYGDEGQEKRREDRGMNMIK